VSQAVDHSTIFIYSWSTASQFPYDQTV